MESELCIESLSRILGIILSHSLISRFPGLSLGILSPMKLRWRNVLFGLFLLANLTSFSQSGFTISGTVMDVTGGFVRATVRLFSADRVREITTNEQGNFVFTNVSPGTYDLEAGGDGWTFATTEGLHVTDKNLTQLSVTVQPGTHSGRCVIAISGSAAKASGLFYDQRVDETNLIGMALGPSGAPLSAASFTLSSSDRTWTVTSDEKGVARFVGLQPGKYSINLSHEGYWGESRPVRITRENLTRITTVLEPTGACR
jgi:Carboxypeptidase regulatory-like domain